jgi:hypothetical protein
MLYPWGEAVAEQLVNKRARYDDAFVNIKIEIALPCLMGKVGGGDVFDCAAFQYCQHFFFLALQQLSIEVGLQRVQRQVEGMQDEVGGFVVRVVRAMPEKQTGIVETADGETQDVADGGQFLGCLGKHIHQNP